MDKNLKNGFGFRFFSVITGRDTQSVPVILGQQRRCHTSPRAGEVDTKCRVRGNKKQTGGTYFHLFSFTLNVILRRERSELSGESRNIMAILSNAANNATSRLFSVINGLVPKILVQQVTNLVNKFAVLLKMSTLRQDCRNKSGNDGCGERRFSVCCSVFNAFTLNVMLACEHSELPRASRLIKSILSKDAKSTAYRLFSVIFGLVPKILLQQVTNQVNTLAILLKRMYHPGSSANELTLKAKDDYKSVLQLGRSMIEMLGVLAIIAVLSVGGIAGYSKAMQKWKINKTIEGYSYLITGLLEHIDDFRPLQRDNGTENDDFRYYLGDVIHGLNLLPEGWKFNSSGVLDTLGNFTAVFTRREKIVFDIHLGTTENVNQSVASMDFSDKICFELLNTAFQPLHSMLYKVFIFKSKTGYIHYYGDGYCGANQKCLRTLTMPEMKQACQSCVLGEDYCILTVEF